ncbi:ABC transporter substrate-binding protein [Treponema parvum]|uniref:ABC transporter substrate-binding protein n=1 Tax=Treponema parvum TaxID=138851 RepID=A0A975F352_9SPIR|nr:ABC transporter substrate-binding protein [Treponema parvum]QTQ13537.1 ABC transporter substrate-binding protein [Treponema parvum]
MKKKVSLVCLTVAAALLFAAGCKASSGEKVIKIGIIQLVEHPALDASYKGFVDGLSEAGFVDGRNIKIDHHNAQGEQANCVTIAQKLINDKDDLILAIATPAAQAVANLTKTIPILVTAVTDPESAKLVKSNASPGTNVTGTSDLTPCAAQMELLKKIVPDAKTVGMMYSSNEQNSFFQIAIAKAACDELGLKYIDGTVSNSNEIQQVAQSLAGKVDVIYIPTDNMVSAGMATVAMVANQNKIPTICGEEGMVDAGGLATYGINYYELGKQTALMAVDILKNGKKPDEMPIQYLSVCDLKINQETAKKIGITVPADLK